MADGDGAAADATALAGCDVRERRDTRRPCSPRRTPLRSLARTGRIRRLHSRASRRRSRRALAPDARGLRRMCGEGGRLGRDPQRADRSLRCLGRRNARASHGRLARPRDSNLGRRLHRSFHRPREGDDAGDHGNVSRPRWIGAVPRTARAGSRRRAVAGRDPRPDTRQAGPRQHPRESRSGVPRSAEPVARRPMQVARRRPPRPPRRSSSTATPRVSIPSSRRFPRL